MCVCLYVTLKKIIIINKKSGVYSRQDRPQPGTQQSRTCPTSFPKAPAVDPTKPLLFGAADRGPQGENLKDFNNTSNPSLHDGLFLSLLSSNWGPVGAGVGMPVLKRK